MEIRKDNTQSTGFGELKGGFLPNSACGLNSISNVRVYIILKQKSYGTILRVLTPVITATPPASIANIVCGSLNFQRYSLLGQESKMVLPRKAWFFSLCLE